MSKQIQKITIDTIRELRKRGLGIEAMAALEAHKKDVKKSGRQARNNILTKDRRIKKAKGVCVLGGCFKKAMKDRVLCKKHTLQNRKSGRNRYWERKEAQK